MTWPPAEGSPIHKTSPHYFASVTHHQPWRIHRHPPSAHQPPEPLRPHPQDSPAAHSSGCRPSCRQILVAEPQLRPVDAYHPTTAQPIARPVYFGSLFVFHGLVFYSSPLFSPAPKLLVQTTLCIPPDLWPGLPLSINIPTLLPNLSCPPICKPISSLLTSSTGLHQVHF